MNFKKLIGALTLIVVLTLWGLPPLSTVAAPAVRVSDTMAGSPLVLETLPMEPRREVTFTVTKPNGMHTTTRATTDSTGIARAHISGDHTRKAGFYEVMVESSSGARSQSMKVEVLPAAISADRSVLTSSKVSVRADNQETATVMLTLKDDHGNVIPNTVITLLAVRDNVITQRVSNVTDARGDATFQVRSDTAGAVIYGIIDERTDTVLSATVRISYYNEGQPLANTGGNNLLAQVDTSSSVLQPSSTSSTLFPAFDASRSYRYVMTVAPTAGVNETMDVTVEVLTTAGDPALDYRGTVIFESNDANAVVPLGDEGYAFTAENLGKHTFFRALSFRSPGSKALRVADVDNPDLFTEQTITITGTGAPVVGGEIQVTYPTQGLRIGTTSIAVLAQGPPNRRVVAYNDTVEVGEVVAGADGAIRLDLTNLSGGRHELELRAFDANNVDIGASTPVVYFVELDPATIDRVYMEPESPVPPSSFVTMFVESDPGLSEVQVQIDNTQRPLTEMASMPGRYSAEVRVPDVAGSYPVRVFLRDQFDNVINQESDLIIVVGSTVGQVSRFTGRVEGLSALLSWDAPADTTGIDSYVVTYGTDPTRMTQTVDLTAGTSSTRVGDLAPDTEYFFVLRVMSVDGAILQSTEVLSLRTEEQVIRFGDVRIDEVHNALEIEWDMEGAVVDHYTLAYGIRSGSYLETIRIPGTSSTYVLDELINGTTYYIQFRAFDANGTELAITDELTAVPGGGQGGVGQPGGTICLQVVRNVQLMKQGEQQYLQWEGISGVEQYRVYAGDTPEAVHRLITTVQGRTYYELPMVSGEEKQVLYYGVKAYCPGTGEESMNLSNILQVESGPAFILFGALTLATSWWYGWRRRRLI